MANIQTIITTLQLDAKTNGLDGLVTNLQRTESELKKNQLQIDLLNKKLREAKTESERTFYGKQLLDARLRMNELNQSLGQNIGYVGNLRIKIKELQLAQEQALNPQQAKKFGDEIAKVQRRLSDVNAAGFSRAQIGIQAAQQAGIQGSGLLSDILAGGATAKIALAGSGIAAIAGGIYSATQATLEFNNRIKELEKITGESGTSLEFYKDKAIELSRIKVGEEFIAFDPTQVIDVFTKIGSFNPELLKNKDALQQITEQALILAKASGLDLNTATDAVTTTLGQFNFEASKAKEVIDNLAAGTKFGASTIPQSSRALQEFGAVAKQANVSLVESNALIQTLAKASLFGGEAGTQARNILNRLDGGNFGKDVLDRFEKAGISITLLRDRTVPLNDKLAELSKGLKDAGLLSAAFEQENSIGINTLVTYRDEFGKLVNQIGGPEGYNEALRAAEVEGRSFSDNLQELKTGFKELGLNIGEFIVPILNNVVGGLNRVFSAFKSQIELGNELRELSGGTLGIFDIKKLESFVRAIDVNLTAVNEKQEQSIDRGIQGLIDKQRNLRQSFENGELSKGLFDSQNNKLEKELVRLEDLSRNISSQESIKPIDKTTATTNKENERKKLLSEIEKTNEEVRKLDFKDSDKTLQSIEDNNRRQLAFELDQISKRESELLSKGIKLGNEFDSLRTAIIAKYDLQLEIDKESFDKNRDKINKEIANRIKELEIKFLSSGNFNDQAKAVKLQLGLDLESIEFDREQALESAKQTGADIVLINSEFDAKSIEAKRDANIAILEIISDRFDKEIDLLDDSFKLSESRIKAALNNELGLLTQSYLKDEISKEDFEQKKLEIQRRYENISLVSQKKSIESQLQLVRAEISKMDALIAQSPNNKQLKNKLAELEQKKNELLAELSSVNNEIINKDSGQKTDNEADTQANRQKQLESIGNANFFSELLGGIGIKNEDEQQIIIEAWTSTLETIDSLFDDFNQRRIDELDEQIDKQQERISDLKSSEDRGNAEQIQRERDRLNKLLQEREKAAKKQAIIAQTEAAAQYLVAVAHQITALAKATERGAETPFPPAFIPIYVAAVIASIVAGGASIIQGFSKIKSGAQSLNKGKRFVDYNDGTPDRSDPYGDDIAAWLKRGERVTPSDINSKYYEDLNAIESGKIAPGSVAKMLDNDVVSSKYVLNTSQLKENHRVANNTSRSSSDLLLETKRQTNELTKLRGDIETLTIDNRTIAKKLASQNDKLISQTKKTINKWNY